MDEKRGGGEGELLQTNSSHDNVNEKKLNFIYCIILGQEVSQIGHTYTPILGVEIVKQ